MTENYTYIHIKMGSNYAEKRMEDYITSYIITLRKPTELYDLHFCIISLIDIFPNKNFQPEMEKFLVFYKGSNLLVADIQKIQFLFIIHTLVLAC